MKKIAALCLGLLFWAAPALAVSPTEIGAPEDLAAWQSWVLYGYEEQYLCPDITQGGRRHQCAWPVSLSLDLGGQGGRFRVVFELKKEGTFPLPGGPGAWPMDVTAETGGAVPVLGRDRPQVWLPAGRHTLTGAFRWPRLPETMTLPLGFVLDLKVDGRPLDFPPLEVDYAAGQARLWLTKKSEDSTPAVPTNATAADRLTVTVNRLVQDSQPMMIKSRFKLIISGQPREVTLNNVLLPETRATYLSSPLPAQLTDGGLRVRVKPGVYEIFLDSRSLGRSESLGPVAETAGEPEYWAFQEPQPPLRQVEISGAAQVDASQVDIYPPWKAFPIYQIQPGESLVFTTLRRGDPDPPPDMLNLARECWLDYDGGGLGCRDRLTGTLSRQWHLNTSPPFTLAQASLDGQPQVITEQTDSHGRPAPGLQLREGRLNLQADLRLDHFTGRLPASGWDHKLDTEGQRLNLPPGYRLLHASGADVKQDARYSGAGTWTGSWGTLDFFIILIITIAAWKLYGRACGLLALAALILGYHEPLAPRMVFLHLLAAAALLRILPAKGKARFLVAGWRFVAALVLVALSALFLIYQARITLHPQLENPGVWYNDSGLEFALGEPRYRAAETDYYDESAPMEDREMMDYAGAPPVPAAAPPATIQNNLAEMNQDLRLWSSTGAGDVKQKLAKPAAPKQQEAYNNRMVHLNQAPDAKVQNSAPRPDWRWRSVRLYYNASVTADQEVRLYLIGPALGRLLGVLRIVLMAAFTLVMLTGGRRPRLKPAGNQTRAEGAPAALAAALLLGLSAAWPGAALAQNGFPSRELLDTYRARLLEVRPVPEASLPELRLTAETERLVLDFTVEAARETVLALPMLDREIFRPERVSLSGRDLPLLEDNGRWLALVPAGRHQQVLEGRLKKATSTFQAFQINFPFEARPQRTVIAASPAWKVDGLEADGQLVSGALDLTATAAAGPADSPAPEKAAEEGTSVTLEPFFLVHRTISMGLEWQVITSVRRITPTGAPVSLKLPLLPGENPITGNLRLDDGRVALNFGPQVEQLSWESSLIAVPEMTLTAADGPWTESWSLDVSPIWRVKTEGLIPIHNTAEGFWQPRWRPWPGESLRLIVDRPQPVPGRYLVIDHGQLRVTAGENNQVDTLNFTVRTSQAGPYSFNLPAGAEVREFKVDGRTVPLGPGAAGGPAEAKPTLTASLSTGEHRVEVSWIQDIPLGAVAATPAIDLGAPTANLNVSLTLPEDRWILWAWGPLQGPAVQFWSLLAVVLLVAAALARFTKTPLGCGAWFLLGMGLIQLNIFGAMIVAGWLLAFSRRASKRPLADAVAPWTNDDGRAEKAIAADQTQAAPANPFWFNAGQVLLVLWTLAALALIYKGIEYGLLRNPDMLIDGGGSYGQYLAWFTDRSAGLWPAGRALSVSVWFYKALMLAWSLWLAVSLVKWLKWAWAAFSLETLWKKSPPRPPKAARPRPDRSAAAAEPVPSEGDDPKRDGE